jgi:hypothetical protein
MYPSQNGKGGVLAASNISAPLKVAKFETSECCDAVKGSFHMEKLAILTGSRKFL